MATTINQLFLDLDRSSPVPLYFQVARRLREAIVAGELGPGERIENEMSLADQLGMSRPTIRRAIQELVDEGLLVRRRGVGTQVVRGRLARTVELTSLFDDLTSGNRAPSTEVLLWEMCTPDDEILEILELPSNAHVLHIKRLRRSEGAPLALLENFLPPEFAYITEEALAHHGLYQLMQARGTTMRVARQTIGARTATEEESQLFEHGAGAPVLTMTRTLFDDSGHAVEYGVHSYHPDLYNFEMTVVGK